MTGPSFLLSLDTEEHTELLADDGNHYSMEAGYVNREALSAAVILLEDRGRCTGDVYTAEHRGCEVRILHPPEPSPVVSQVLLAAPSQRKRANSRRW